MTAAGAKTRRGRLPESEERKMKGLRGKTVVLVTAVLLLGTPVVHAARYADARFAAYTHYKKKR